MVVIMGIDFTCLLDAFKQGVLPPVPCLVKLASKAAGYGIVLFSTIIKLPQILLILRNKSVTGLSMAFFEMEAVGYTIALSYCLKKELPFSAYGELFFMLIQALVLVLLLYHYTPAWASPSTWFKAGLYLAMAPVLLTGVPELHVFETLFACQTLLFTSARLPQIYKNYKAGNTGQLSFASVFANAAGCIVRLLTGIVEKVPIGMLVSSVLGLITNGTMAAQVLLYAQKKPPVKKASAKEKASAKVEAKKDK